MNLILTSVASAFVAIISVGVPYMAQSVDEWVAAQREQDCPPPPYNVDASTAVILLTMPGTPGQRESVPGRLWSRPNRRGEGFIVTGFKDSNKGQDYTRRRFIWLVLDKAVYPLSAPAAAAQGKQLEPLPDPVQKRAGLSAKPLTDLGLVEVAQRQGTVGNPFPACK